MLDYIIFRIPTIILCHLQSGSDYRENWFNRPPRYGITMITILLSSRRKCHEKDDWPSTKSAWGKENQKQRKKKQYRYLWRLINTQAPRCLASVFDQCSYIDTIIMKFFKVNIHKHLKEFFIIILLYKLY